MKSVKKTIAKILRPLRTNQKTNSFFKFSLFAL